MQVETAWGSPAVVAVGGRLSAALLALSINFGLLALVAKVIVLNDGLATVVSPLRATQLQLCEIITRSEEEKVSQALCLRKLEIMREHWESELFGLRLAVPLAHSTHGSGVAVHPYYFLSFQLAIGGELLLCALRSLTATPWAKLGHSVWAALLTAVGLVAMLHLAESWQLSGHGFLAAVLAAVACGLFAARAYMHR